MNENEKFQEFFFGFLNENGKKLPKPWKDMTEEERTAVTLKMLGGKK
jgi:hypothetical protein